jgi:O-acetyl-ADP-ribose deacetylase (regulator of RNase III)
MDILLFQASVYELPSSRRVGVIVHDGSTDTRLWPGPGPDRELLHAYGPGLQEALDRERSKVGAELPIGGLLRLHPGRLHCDFLVWIATRPPERAGRQAPAPDRAMVEHAVCTALDYVAERGVVRIAFPALGAGPGAPEDAERMAIVARACHRWQEDRFERGRATVVEEVLICDPRLSVVTSARRRVSDLVKAAALPPRAVSSAPEPKPAERPSTATKDSSGRKKRLDEVELARARAMAPPWDRTVRYKAGDWFVHGKFGVGRVHEVTPDGYILVLFEDGEVRKLIHGRPA